MITFCIIYRYLNNCIQYLVELKLAIAEDGYFSRNRRYEYVQYI